MSYSPAYNTYLNQNNQEMLVMYLVHMEKLDSQRDVQILVAF